MFLPGWRAKPAFCWGVALVGRGAAQRLTEDRRMKTVWWVATIIAGCAPSANPALVVAPADGGPAGGDAAGLAAGDAGLDTAAWGRDPRCPVGYCNCCGLCQFDGEGKQCVAKSPADCLQSSGCSAAKDSWGACMLMAGACAEGPDDAACAGSSACKASAKCAFVKGHCAPGSQADCAGSAICKSAARCTFAQGECIPQTDADCLQSYLCSHSGECHFVDDGSSNIQGGAAFTGRCRAATDADCKQSEVCLQYQWCTKSKSGSCTKSPG
jgi:hypothetical protein